MGHRSVGYFVSQTNAKMKIEENAVFNIAKVDDAIYDKIIALKCENENTYIEDGYIKRLRVNEINSIEDIIKQYYEVQIDYALNCQVEEEKVNTLDIIVKKISLINRCIEIINNKHYSCETKSYCVVEVLKMYPEKTPWMYEQEDATDAEYIILECIKEYIQAIKQLTDVVKIVASQMQKILVILNREKSYYIEKYN